MKHKTVIFGMLVLLMAACVGFGTADVLAQTGGPYDLSWSTVDGGSQSSSGGTYSIGGTAGQPDASGALTGGSFELMGGFWSFQESNPTPVTLHSLNAASPTSTTGLSVGMALVLIVCLGGTLLWKQARQR